MAKHPAEIRSLARAYAKVAIQSLGGIAKNGESEAARVSAAAVLLDRGYGKPKQVHQHGGGEEGEGPIVVKIVYSKDED